MSEPSHAGPGWTVEVDVDEALRRIVLEVRPLPPIELPAEQTLGLATAEDHAARWALPTADVATMDGWAVAASELSTTTGDFDVELRLVGESAAGHMSATPHAPGTTQRISTGAVLPAGHDAVVAVEDTSLDGTRRVVHVRPDAARQTSTGRFVRRAGSDLRTGDIVVPKGRVVDVPTFAAAAAAGHATLAVHRRPRVAIVSTGDELVPIGTAPAAGQTPSTNAAMLAVLLRAEGEVVERHELADDETLVFDTLRSLARRVDVIVTTGGNSVGEHDHVASALAKLARTEPHTTSMSFRRVAMRPGRPTSMARLGSTWLFALAGNPASTFVGATLFVRTALRRLAGHDEARARPIEVALALGQALRALDSRDDFVRVRVEGHVAYPLPNQVSGALSSLAGADALVRVPRSAGHLPEGSVLAATPLTDAALRAALSPRSRRLDSP